MERTQAGSTLGHYKIIRRLGAGGMGIVYEAEDLKLGRHVALKVISGKTEADPGILDRFWREARTASALNHPGICTLYEINESEGQPFLVMELLEGQTLDRIYGGHAVPLPRLIELAIQLADALDSAHHRGILHRDIKPSNIFVTGSGQTKILDFGLARFQDSESPGSSDADTRPGAMHTTSGATLGTIAYMSPEQARGEPLDARSDIFSLGVVLYEMSTGKHPFEGTASAVVFDKLLNYAPAAAISLNHELPPEFETILSKALEKERDLRYQSAADLRADLRRLQRSSSASRIVAGSASPQVNRTYAGMTRVGPAAPASAAPVRSGSGTGDRIAPLARSVLVGAATALLVITAVTFGVWHHVRSRAHAAAVAAVVKPAAPAPVPAPAMPTPKPAAGAAQPSASVPRAPERRKAEFERRSKAETPHMAAPPVVSQPAVAAAPVAPVRPPAAVTPPPVHKPAPVPAPAPPVIYSARRMRFLGLSSSGKLRLSPTALIFSSGSDSVSLTRAQIRTIDGNTVVQANGKRLRFEIAGMSNEQVHSLLARWFAAH